MLQCLILFKIYVIHTCIHTYIHSLISVCKVMSVYLHVLPGDGGGGGGGAVTKKADLQKHWEQKEKAKQQRMLEERQAQEALEQKQVPYRCLHTLSLFTRPVRLSARRLFSCIVRVC